jgi:hypothetical protein
MNVERTHVATGQVGQTPLIYIWDSVTAKPLGNVKLPRGSRAVTAIGFNKSSDLIACADFSNDHTIYCFDWKMKQLKFA